MIDNITYDMTKNLKIFCHSCGQKLNVTGLPPFSPIACPHCDTALTVPVWFDTYLLEELAGIGGMATVFRALDVTLDREVAIKILNKEIVLAGNNIELFLHEARTSAIINHQNVIPIYTCGVFMNQPYIVMQFMNCGSLQEIMDKHGPQLPVANLIQWMHDTTLGLEAALRYGVTHHDIKPANIMLDMEQRAKIGDFGISSSINSQHNNLVDEQLKTWVTPDYVSPEKVLYETEDFRGDIYSLGASFFYLFTGQNPFHGNTINELVYDRTQRPPQFIHELRAEIPMEISQLIMSMMHLNAAKRPSYTHIIQTLQKFLPTPTSTQNVRGTKTLKGIKAKSKMNKSSKTTVPRSTRPRQQPSNSSALIIAIVLGAIVALVIGVIIAVNANTKPPPPKPTPKPQPIQKAQPKQYNYFGTKAK